MTKLIKIKEDTHILLKTLAVKNKKTMSGAIDMLLYEQDTQESFYHTVVRSQQWKKWVKYNEKELQFDVHESIECDMISEKHLQAFFKFIK